MNVFRLHIRPGGGLANARISFAYCLDKQVLGMGWQTHSDKVISSWEEYVAEATKHSEELDLSRVRFLKDRVKPDDLVWTRSPAGEYYLAKVLSGWEYLASKEAQDADIVNVVRCRILPVPRIDQVPGKIVACFRATRTIQSVKDEHARRYTAQLWNKLSSSADYAVEQAGRGSIFSFLRYRRDGRHHLSLFTDERLARHSPHAQSRYDALRVLLHPPRNEAARHRAGENRDARLRTADWVGRPEQVFLFQSKGLYEGVVPAQASRHSPQTKSRLS